ncbi:MAG TPA: hypothetical protein VNN80_04905 [Polyangiaceae bacterium]|jgi:hypothetical protein|nr:hypothetical protein [Polyangiaceae bacterium]
MDMSSGVGYPSGYRHAAMAEPSWRGDVVPSCWPPAASGVPLTTVLRSGWQLRR